MISSHLSEWCGQGMAETSAASKFQGGSQDSGSWEAVAPNPIPRQVGEGGGSACGLLKLSWVWCSLGFLPTSIRGRRGFPFPNSLAELPGGGIKKPGFELLSPAGKTLHDLVAATSSGFSCCHPA